jgi:hypothetical protein
LQLPAELADDAAKVTLAVVDSYGRSWLRHPDGTLARVTTESSASRSSPQGQLRWEAR